LIEHFLASWLTNSSPLQNLATSFEFSLYFSVPTSTTTTSMNPTPHVNFSKFANADAPTVDIPMSVINRPLPSELSEEKVQQFMKDIQVSQSFVGIRTPANRGEARAKQAGDKFTPIEVLRTESADGKKYYIAFGGCHRYVNLFHLTS